MDVSAVVAEFGAYYRAGGRGTKDLLRLLMEKSETEMLFPVRITDSTRLEAARATFGKVLQRFQTAWTPKDGVTFTPKIIDLQKLKIDAEDYPDNLEESWLGFLASDDLDRKQWPFVKWWIEGILRQAQEDMEKDEIFWGVPGTITPGTATAARTNLLGIRKQINDGITAATITPHILGAVPTDPVLFVTYVEAFWDGIPELEQAEIDIIMMSRTLRTRFQKGMRAKYNVNYNQAGDLLTVMDHSVQVKGLLSMEGSTKLIATPQWNRQRAIKKPGNETIMRVENVDRKVKVYTDYFKGVGFWVLQYLHTNDVDLV